MNDTKRGIDAIAGVNEVLKYRKENPKASEGEIMKHIMNFIRNKKFKDTKMDIISAVSRTIKILEKEPSLKDRQVINRMVDDLKSILA